MKTTKFLKTGGELLAETGPRSRKPRRITLWVVVPVSEQRTAERAARAYADGGLEEVLAAFVSDWATAEERPGSWEAERVNAWLASHVWAKKERAWEARQREGA